MNGRAAHGGNVRVTIFVFLLSDRTVAAQNAFGAGAASLYFVKGTAVAIGARAHAKFGAENTIEIGNISKSAIERDVQDLRRFGSQTHGDAT